MTPQEAAERLAAADHSAYVLGRAKDALDGATRSRDEAAKTRQRRFDDEAAGHDSKVEQAKAELDTAQRSADHWAGLAAEVPPEMGGKAPAETVEAQAGTAGSKAGAS